MTEMSTMLWSALPDDMQWKIRGERAKILLSEHPDLLMTSKYGACYCCGGWSDVSASIYWDDISYNFCGTCNDGLFKHLDTLTKVMYSNAWGCNDTERWSRMYHTSVAPEVTDDTWDDFWEHRMEGMTPDYVHNSFRQWSERMDAIAHRYADDWLDDAPPTPPHHDNGHVFDWGDSDDEVES